MKIVICLSALIAVALACSLPCASITRKICDYSNLPTFISSKLKIVELDSCLADQLFQGDYFVTVSVPSRFNNHAIKTSLFGNTFPAGSAMLTFGDATPCLEGDSQYSVASYTYNCLTGKAERTLSLLNRALGPQSDAGVFNLYLEAIYENTLLDETIIGCKSFVERTVDKLYSQRVLVAVIGFEVEDYILFAVLDKWTSSLFGNEDVNVFAITKSQSPCQKTIEKIINDLDASGINLQRLWFIDQSIKISDLPSYIAPRSSLSSSLSTSALSSNEVEGSLLTTTSTSQSSISNIDESSVTTTSRTTVRFTTDVMIDSEYKPFAKLVTNPLLPHYKCINDFELTTLEDALSGKYYVFATTPSTSGDCLTTGFFSVGYPTIELQVIFDVASNYKPLGPDCVRMMYDSSVNAITGEVTIHKSILYFPLGFENKGILGLWTEAYGTSSGSSCKSLVNIDDKLFVFKPDYSKHYGVHKMLSIIGYGDGYMIILEIDTSENLFFEKEVNNVYVLTRKSAPPSDVVRKIAQDLLQNKIELSELMRMCQTQDILEDYSFDASEFYVDIEITASSKTTVKSSVSVSYGTTSEGSCQCQC